MWGKEQLAYLAGIIDGEGSIHISKNKKGYKIGAKNPSHNLRLYITSTNKTLIDWLCLQFGGNTVYKKQHKNNKNQKASWDWYIDATKAVTILKAVYSYLLIKKPQAQLAIEFQKQKTNKSGKKLTPQIIQIRDNYKNKMMILNKRGVGA